MRAMRKKHIHASAADLFMLPRKKIGNLNWCKCKNEAREIDSLCCREVDAMVNASAKIPKSQGNILSSSFYGQLL